MGPGCQTSTIARLCQSLVLISCCTQSTAQQTSIQRWGRRMTFTSSIRGARQASLLFTILVGWLAALPQHALTQANTTRQSTPSKVIWGPRCCQQCHPGRFGNGARLRLQDGKCQRTTAVVTNTVSALRHVGTPRGARSTGVAPRDGGGRRSFLY